MNLELFIASAGDLTPYAILLLIYLLLSVQSELSGSRTFAVPALGLLVLFAGFREAMTIDMERYSLMYSHVDALSIISIEPSFLFLSHLLNGLGFDYHALFFTYTLITLTFVYLGIRNYTANTKFSLLLYVLLPGCFLNLFVEMREVAAVGITFYATSVLSRKDVKWRLTIVCVLAALSICFHYSALAYWGIIVVSYKVIKRPHSLFFYYFLLISTLLIPTSVLIGAIDVLASPILPTKYHGYLGLFMETETSLAESGQLLKNIVYILIGAVCVYWRSPLDHNDDDHVPLNLFVIGVVILNVTRSFAEASRLAYFFTIYQIVILPTTRARLRAGVMRLTAAYAVVLFYLAQFAWGLFYYSDEWDTYPFLHYQNVVFTIFR
jgi:transmembrane protein EpsG